MNEVMKLNKIANEAKDMSNLYWKLAVAIKNRDPELVIKLSKKIENLRIEIESSLAIDL